MRASLSPVWLGLLMVFVGLGNDRCLGALAPYASQWDLNASLAESSGGSSITLSFSPPATRAGLTYTNSEIAGESAQVAAFTRGTLLRLTHRLAPNGGGTLVNRYTLILDVRFEARTADYTALLQTTSANSNDADWFLNRGGALGISGNYGGVASDGEWHRLALVVDAGQGVYKSYIDGQLVQTQTAGVTLDGRFSLGPVLLLFADNDQETSGGLLNSVQVRGDALSDGDVAALGGPRAPGIPRAAPTQVRLLYPNGGEVLSAGTQPEILWQAENPVGFAQLQLWQGQALRTDFGTVALNAGKLSVALDRYIGNASNYRIRLIPLADTNLVDFSDDFFSIDGSSTLNPKYGVELQRNGGFEQSLTNWTVQAGNPVVLLSGQGKGTPRSGTRFLHGGKATKAPESRVVQLVDLNDAGFSDQELDDLSQITAEGWLRNLFDAGTFDDQVYYQIRYLDADGVELSSIRSILPATGVWSRQRVAGLLPPGTRRLSLEVIGKHRRDADNDSMADDLVLKLARPAPAIKRPRITKLPMLQDYRQDAMTLLWETDGNDVTHDVAWGVQEVGENVERKVSTLQIDATHYVHRVTITGLQPETAYRYQVRSGLERTAVYSFRTAPRQDSPFAVAWWGDNHDGTGTLRTHVSNILSHVPNMICVAGDMVNSGNNLSDWHDFWFKPLEHMSAAQTTPVLFARGNHDGEHALAYAYSSLPGNEAWFSFPYGNSWFIFLDSEIDSTTVPEQLTWLRTELQRPEVQRAAFRIVCFHKPPWTDFWNGGGYVGETWVRQLWTPVFAANGVDIVICGHTHAYSRGMNQGVMYVVSGGGGGTVDTERVAQWPMFEVEYTNTHFDLMEVYGLNLDWQMYSERNQLMDEFRLHSRTAELTMGETHSGAKSTSLVLTGRNGMKYALERSEDLLKWEAFATNTVPAAPVDSVTNLLQISHQKEFVRARTLP
jgi:predicted phosphodiesterase